MTDSRKRQRPSAVGSPRGARRVSGTALALLLLSMMRAPASLTATAFGSKPSLLTHTLTHTLPRGASLPFFGRATSTRLRQSSSNRGEPTRPTTPSDARTTTASSRNNSTTTARRLCFYQSPAHKNHWRPRVDLADLTVGQELNGAVVVQELLDGRTGPKLFLEVGVGRYCGDAKADRTTTRPSSTTDKDDDPAPLRGDWHMVRAMLRLGTKFAKVSVARKRAARLRKKDYFQVYVSAVRPASGQLEVCLTRDETLASRPRKMPVRDLPLGHEYTGVVVRVEDYGVLVDVGAVRPGLLPLRRVADLMGHYIPQAAGLVKAGLERGARIKVQVTPTNTTEGSSSSKKKFALDFTDAVKEEAAVERARRAAVKAARLEARSSPPAVAVTAASVDPSAATTAADVSATASELSEEEALAWAAFASNPSAPSSEIAASHDEEDDDEDDEEEYDEDDYDEDREIEDALGLGSY